MVADVAQRVHRKSPERSLETGVLVLARRADERPAAAPAARLDQAHRAQRRERVTQRDGGHAELLCEVAFRGQPLAVEQQPEADRVGQPSRDRLGAPTSRERREQRACSERR
jgi:hypothetical protein